MLDEGSSEGNLNAYKIVNSNRGKTLLHAGHRYSIHRTNKTSTVWNCIEKRKSRCRGAVKFENETNTVIVQRTHHAQCTPNYFKNELKVVLQKTKDEMCITHEPAKKIYEMNINNLKNQGYDGYNIPAFENVKSQLYGHRKKNLRVCIKNISNDGV